MDELIKSLDSIHITEHNRYKTVIPEYVLNWIYKDIDYMFTQLVSNEEKPIIFELFKNINMYSSYELEIIYKYIEKYGQKILENKLKNSKLYYDNRDISTYMDYYLNELYEQISLMRGC